MPDQTDPPNLPLLIKLLKMTTSSNDGEALLAIRKANEQLLKFGGDWEALLRGRVTVIADPFAGEAAMPPPSQPKPAPPSPLHPRPQPRPAPPPPRPAAPRTQPLNARPLTSPQFRQTTNGSWAVVTPPGGTEKAGDLLTITKRNGQDAHVILDHNFLTDHLGRWWDFTDNKRAVKRALHNINVGDLA